MIYIFGWKQKRIVRSYFRVLDRDHESKRQHFLSTSSQNALGRDQKSENAMWTQPIEGGHFQKPCVELSAHAGNLLDLLILDARLSTKSVTTLLKRVGDAWVQVLTATTTPNAN